MWNHFDGYCCVLVKGRCFFFCMLAYKVMVVADVSGHVMGMATWMAVLSENSKCPFTKQPLNRDQIKALLPTNIEIYRDRIITGI